MTWRVAAATVVLAGGSGLAGAGSPWATATPTPAAAVPSPRSTPAATRATKKTPVSKEEALAIARKTVAAIEPSASFVVLEKGTVEKAFGWVFFYEPKAAAGDPGAVVPGAGPLVVHRLDGSTEFLSSSVPPQVAIAEYEKIWARRRTKR